MGDESRFKSYEQDEGALFPVFLADALDPSHPAFFVQDAVEGLDLRAFEAPYAVLEERAYAPRLMLKLWLYAATQGVYSGREIARRIRRDVGFRYLAGSSRHPDFRTINRFRVRHREDFAECFARRCGWRGLRAWVRWVWWRSMGPRSGPTPANPWKRGTRRLVGVSHLWSMVLDAPA